MKARSPTLLLALLMLTIEISAQPSSENKPGCSLIEGKYQSQYVTFKKLEATEPSNERPLLQLAVLRIWNNTNCDITLLAWEHEPRRMAIVKGPDGKNRIIYTTDFPDGSFIENLKYIIQLQEPPPPANPRKKLIATDEVLDYFVLKSGRSALFKVPFDRFDKWITVEVPFYYSWDLQPNATRVYHRAYFGNLDLPDDVFKRTKVCHTLTWCK
jgi:hypothetical protein